MSLWSDYDNICGGCEDSVSIYEDARGIAREAWLRFCDRWDWYQSMPIDFQAQEPEAYKAIHRWLWEQFTSLD
jgi:hypothetical protein